MGVNEEFHSKTWRLFCEKSQCEIAKSFNDHEEFFFV